MMQNLDMIEGLITHIRVLSGKMDHVIHEEIPALKVEIRLVKRDINWIKLMMSGVLATLILGFTGIIFTLLTMS